MTSNIITWDAEEYITKSHNGWWYFGLVIVTAGLSALAVWLQGWTFLALIFVSAITVLVFNLRPPRKIHYSITSTGLTEGKQKHSFIDYRAFGIVKEDSHYSAVLIPKKRFGLNVKVYFPEGSGEAIVDALGARLPMEEVKPDLLDKLVSFLRI
ncbi:hypothetical protein IJI79_01030 [Candidatus Saccharibacteria bacterium]|nr:hypothetical protein [Candidatus Saccharibacteria bacterium]MBR0424071.1 hypothetical protein [Candidatus Saccharibacteria bacterium]